MKYVIIEDERLAYEEILRMMRRLRPLWEFAGWAYSVQSAVDLLGGNHTDILLADIRLSDGLSFEIFEQLPCVGGSIIFTTAYDEYALNAFRHGGVGYLLKPIVEDDLDQALARVEQYGIKPQTPAYEALEESYLSGSKKSRFLVHVGDSYLPIQTSDVAFFYSEDKYTYLHTLADRRYIIPYTIDKLERILPTASFFRLSRGCIANIRSIERVNKYFTGRLKVSFRPECPNDVIVTRSRAEEFLKWMDDAR